MPFNHSPLHDVFYCRIPNDGPPTSRDTRLNVRDNERRNVLNDIEEVRSRFTGAARNLSVLACIAGDKDAGDAQGWVLAEAAFYAGELLLMARDLELVQSTLDREQRREQKEAANG